MQYGNLDRYRWHLLDAVQLSAIAFAALTLVPAGAHVFDIHAKLQLPPAEYLAVQRLQDGFVLFAVAGLLAAAAIGVHTFIVRRSPASYGWSIAALVGVVAAQIVFWSLAYPVSAETESWTALPADFEAARRQWEYAFAATGALAFGGLLAFVRAIEASRPIASVAILESVERDAAVRAARMRARSLDGDKAQLERTLTTRAA
jgi:hypothetical protein